MTKSFAALITAAALCTAVALCTSAANAGGQIVRWDFRISEDQIRNSSEPDGSTDSAATGWGHMAFDPSTETLYYTMSWADLEGDLTKLHIHGPALPGESNTNHLIEIFNTVGEVLSAGLDPRNDSYTASVQLDGAQTVCTSTAATPTVPAVTALPCFLDELAYVNVHTTIDPMGEIRGNLVLQPAVVVWDFASSEDQVQNGSEIDGSTNSQGSGRSSLRFDTATETLDYAISWAALEGDLTKLHVHGPAAPDSSQPNHLFEIFNTTGEIAPLDPRDDVAIGSVALSSLGTSCEVEAGDSTTAADATLPCLFEGKAYVNVHTTVDPVGELRGNSITQPGLIVWTAPIDESQVKNGDQPDGSTDSVAGGSAIFRFNVHNGMLNYRIVWHDLEGDLTKLHIHGPATADQSNPNHLIEIFNTAGEVLSAGLDPRDDAYEGEIALDLAETACSAVAGGSVVASTATLPCFLSEQAYINVHTTVVPVGEIRGNLLALDHPHEWDFPFSEDQVNNGDEADGSTNSLGTGRGLLQYDANTQELRYELSWQDLEGGLTKLHLHGPASVDESQPNHLVELFNTIGEITDAGLDRTADTLHGSTQLDRSAPICQIDPAAGSGLDEASPSALPCFLEERAYVNVHTEVDPVGEIRGNLLLVPEPSPAALAIAATLTLASLRFRVRRKRRPTEILAVRP